MKALILLNIIMRVNWLPTINTNYTKGAVTDTPAYFWNVHWTGIGNLANWTICNTIQGGIFGRPVNSCCSTFFDATWRCWRDVVSQLSAIRGLTVIHGQLAYGLVLYIQLLIQ